MDKFIKPDGMISYSKQLLEEGKKYYGQIKLYPDGRIVLCDADGMELEEIATIKE